MMQKDEADLLDAWFKYYGYMFGFGNLEVIDNGSTDPAVLETLAKYELVGSKINRQYPTKQDFLHKGDIAKAIIDSWDSRFDYDLALPVDCDEFLVYFKDNEIRCDRDGLHASLDTLVRTRSSGLIQNSLMNVPDKSGWFYMYGVPKALLAAGTVDYLDNGFHYPRVKSGSALLPTNLMYVHLHNRSFEKLLEFSRRKLENYIDVTDLDTVRSYTGISHHLAKYFLMTQEEYARQYADAPTLFLPEIADLFNALGVDLEKTLHGAVRHSRSLRAAGSVTLQLPAPQGSVLQNFRADYYLQAHPDVAESGIHPVAHYSLFGFREGRSISGPITGQ